MQTPLSVRKIELQTKSPARSRVTSPVESSSERTAPMENSMIMLSKKQDFIINQRSEQGDQNAGTISGLTQNRHSSIVSDSKLTNQYSQMWDNEEDRQRVMARFRSFDMTGMTKYNSYNQRSPSQISEGHPQNAQDNNANVAHQLAQRPGQDSKQQILNIITKLPSIGATPTPGSPTAFIAPEINTAQQLAQGSMMFTLQQQKNFVKHNTNNVTSNAHLITATKNRNAPDSPSRAVFLPATEASSYLGRQQALHDLQYQNQYLFESLTPMHAHQQQQQSQDQSFVSFQVQSGSFNHKAGITDTSAANFSALSPGGAVPQTKQYEKPKEKFFRHAQLGLQVGKVIKMENQYDLRNYRLDNKKLQVGLPGEKKAKFYEKSYEEREKIDNKKLDKYVDKIYGNQGDLQLALRETYNQAQSDAIIKDGVGGLRKAGSNFEQVKQLVMQTAQDQIAHSQRLRTITKIKETRNDTPKHHRQHNSVAAILAQAKTEAEVLNMKESPFLGGQNSKFPGRIMVGMESVQQLMPYKGSQTARSYAAGRSASAKQAPDEIETHLPRELAQFLEQKSNVKRRPARLQTLSAQVKHGRKFTDSSLTNQRVRHFSLFPKANKIVQDTLKFKNVSENLTLQRLAKDVNETMKGKQSVTCLTGTGNQAGLLCKFDDFKKIDRNNPFTVEEYYFLRNNLPTLNDEKPKNQTLNTLESIQSLSGLNQSQQMRKSMREFANDNDVIHVTIDKQSLAQLTKLSERDIKRDENVRLVTKRSGSGDAETGEDQEEPIKENPHIKTMYGTFNHSPIDPDAKRLTEAVFDKLKSGQTTTDGLLDTASHGTTVQEKKLTPRNALFDSAGFAQDTPIVFGVTSTNEVFAQGRLSARKDQIEIEDQNLNQTQPGPSQTGLTLLSSQMRTSRVGKQGGLSQRQSKLTLESFKSQELPSDQRPSKIKIMVDDENKVLQQLNMEIFEQRSQDATEERDDRSADRTNIKDAPKANSPSTTSGPVPIFSKINPHSTRQIESIQSLQKSENGGIKGENMHEIVDQTIPQGGAMTPVPQTSPNKLPTSVINSAHGGASMPETEELHTSTLKTGDKNLATDESRGAAILQRDKPGTADMSPGTGQGNSEEVSVINRQEYNERPVTQEIVAIAENIVEATNQHVLIPSPNQETLEKMPNVLLNVESTLLKLTNDSQSDEKVNQGQPQSGSGRHDAGSGAIVIISRSQTDPETANFIKVDGQTERQTFLDADLLGQTMQDMSMRATKVSIKIGDRHVSDLSAEDQDELDKFNRMSLPRKREYISMMSRNKSGFKTPGMIMDDLIDHRITELDDKFAQINFGQAITHKTFEPFVPKKLTKEENEAEYRTWKLRQIILKQYQFEERAARFEKNLDKFQKNKQRIHDFRKLAVQGYDKAAAMDKESQLMNESGSQLLFLDGKGNLHSSSSKQLQELFWPKGANYNGIDLRNEIEHKVRQLLGRTELSEIASTAKVLVEISDQQSGMQNIFNPPGDLDDPTQQQSPSGFQTSKITLSPRQTAKSRLLKQVNSGDKK